MKVSEENCCVVCKATEVDFKYELKYGKVFYCRNCSVAYTHFNDIENFYKANEVWNTSDRLKSQIYMLPESRKEASKRLNLLLKFAKGKKLIEFGPNTGEFLSAANNKGFQVTAVDKCPAILNLNKFEGLQFIHINADNFIPEEKYDVAVAFHLLEHLTKPRKFLEQILKSLHPEGVLFLEVPNYDSLSRKRQGRDWFMFYDYHIVHFNLASISRLLNDCGFKVVYFRCLQPINLLFDPLYLPVRHLIWNCIKFLSGINKNQVTINTDKKEAKHSFEISLEDEIKISNSIKSKAISFEMLLKKIFSISFLLYALGLEKTHSADVIQVIAKPKN